MNFTKVSSSALGLIRFDPDNRQNRSSSEVKSYKLSPEELAKYNPEPYKKPSFACITSQIRKDCDNMNLKYDFEKLLEICREHGTGAKAVTIAAKELGMTEKQVSNQIWLKKVQSLIAQEKAEIQAAEEVEKQIEIAPEEKIKTPEALKKMIEFGIDVETAVEKLCEKGYERRVVTRYASQYGYQAKFQKYKTPKQKENTSNDCKAPEITKAIGYPADSKYAKHMEICNYLNKTYFDKNTAYGDAFSKTFQELGIISAVTRMYDKFNRIKALAKGADNKVNDESIKDTLMDLANYCIMTSIELDEQSQRS